MGAFASGGKRSVSNFYSNEEKDEETATTLLNNYIDFNSNSRTKPDDPIKRTKTLLEMISLIDSNKMNVDDDFDNNSNPTIINTNIR